MRRFNIILTICLFAAAVLLPAAAMAAPGKFIGNEPCEECHKEIYKSWKESAHAKVFDLLKPGVREKEKKEAGLKPETDYRTDKSCMNCHVTGWDKPGGFTFEEQQENLKGIGCEECHGAAEKWLKLHDQKDLKYKKRRLKHAGLIQPFRGKTVCAQCHYNTNSPYKYRDPHRERDWTDPKMAETYHILK